MIRGRRDGCRQGLAILRSEPLFRGRGTRLSRRLLTSNGGKLMLLLLLRVLWRRGQRSSVDVALTRRRAVHTERDLLVQRTQSRDLRLHLSETLLEMLVVFLECDDMVTGCVRRQSEDNPEINHDETHLSPRETPCCSSGWRQAAPPSAGHSRPEAHLAAFAQPLFSACGLPPCACWQTTRRGFRDPCYRRRQKWNDLGFGARRNW